MLHTITSPTHTTLSSSLHTNKVLHPHPIRNNNHLITRILNLHLTINKCHLTNKGLPHHRTIKLLRNTSRVSHSPHTINNNHHTNKWFPPFTIKICHPPICLTSIHNLLMPISTNKCLHIHLNLLMIWLL